MKKALLNWKKSLLLSTIVATATPAEAESFLDVIFGGNRNNRPRPQQPAPSTGGGDALAKIGEWRIYKTAWDSKDEEGFSRFVQAIGRSGCMTVDSCIRHEVNPYRNTDPTPSQYKFWSDCADWPYFLRSYYAWKNGLPMVYSAGMIAFPPNAEQQRAIDEGREKPQTDVRYSWNGNYPSRRVVVPNLETGVSNFFKVHEQLQNTVHTATLRVDPRTNYGDMYTPAVRRGAIRPGTTVYDPSGHVGIVYDVTDDGQVMVFDALIDRKSISPRRPYSTDFYKRSNVKHGGWFQNFRPVVIDGARKDFFGKTYSGGKAYLYQNEQIPDQSVEMFGNTMGPKGENAYEINGKLIPNFQEFLRRRMFKGTYKIDVISEFKIRMKAICDDFGSRVSLVQDATIKGIASKPHAEVLPNTIYGGDGEWDLYSTPGGDVRRRNSVNSALNSAKELKSLIDGNSPEHSYKGQDLKADFIKAAQDTLKSCKITYRNSADQPVTRDLETLLKRMHLMSFSPWHCVELRWGATSKEELSSCRDLNDGNKMRWYRAQQILRNQMVRDTNIFTGYTVEEVEARASQLGPAQPENFNLLERLKAEL